MFIPIIWWNCCSFIFFSFSSVFNLQENKMYNNNRFVKNDSIRIADQPFEPINFVCVISLEFNKNSAVFIVLNCANEFSTRSNLTDEWIQSSDIQICEVTNTNELIVISEKPTVKIIAMFTKSKPNTPIHVNNPNSVQCKRNLSVAHMIIITYSIDLLLCFGEYVGFWAWLRAWRFLVCLQLHLSFHCCNQFKAIVLSG